MKRSALKLLVTFLTITGFVPALAVNSRDLLFHRLTTDQGLGSNLANAIAQDAHGFIWIGTHEGLCRFDGYKMQVFQQGQGETSLSSGNISALVTDNENIWVGTWDGLNIINTGTFAITRVNTGGTRVIRALFMDKDGRVWVGTPEGALVFEEGSDAFRRVTKSNKGLSHDMVRSFHQDINGDIWIGTYNGLNRYRDGLITSYNLKGDYKPLLKNNLVCTIIGKEGSDSLLWVGTETGLVLFNTSTGTYKHYNVSNTRFSNEVIKAIHTLNDTTLLLGTDFGLNLFNTRSGNVEVYYHDPLAIHTITSNVIWQIFEDNHHRLWFVTSNGVSVLDNNPSPYIFREVYYSFATPRIGNQVRDIFVAANQDTWLATIHGVVHKCYVSDQRTSFSSSAPMPRRILLDNVHCIQQDSLGRIWIGTAGGINIWDNANEKMHIITANENNGLTSNYISNFVFQGDSIIWVAAWEGGLFRGKIYQKYPPRVLFELVTPDGNGVLINSGSRIYYGSNDKLWTITGEAPSLLPVETVNDFLKGRTISGLTRCANGNIFLGYENGLARFDPKNNSIYSININTGRSQNLTNLQVDAGGNVWATTRNMIIRARIESGEYFTIPIATNLPLKSFYNNSSKQTARGKILFGGDNGYIELWPSKIDSVKTKPEVFITGLKINNEEILPSAANGLMRYDIAFSDKINLKHFQNSITFEFSTLDYLFPGVSQFYYRLLPGNGNWVTTPGNKNFAVFSNLNPGKYTLEVKGTNSNGTLSDVRRLNLRISPSIWLSHSFLVLYAALVISLTYLAFRVYSYRQRLNGELKLVKLQKENADALYQSKINFFTNISHEFRTPLSLIIPPIQEFLKKVSPGEADTRMLLIAHRNAQRLYKLVNQLLDFRKMESVQLELHRTTSNLNYLANKIFHSFDDIASRHEIKYTFEAPVEPIIVDVDVDKVETIIFNLLSNAFKFTHFGGIISLSLSANHTRASIRVADNGPGIPGEEQPKIFDHFYQVPGSKSEKTGTGIGLTLSREYAHLHGGELIVKSQEGEGSEFTLSLPVKSNDGTCHETGDQISLANDYYHALDKPTAKNHLPAGCKRLLLVDDNEDLLAFMEMAMRGTYQIYCSKNGDEGVKMAVKVHPHLVVCDVTMPVMDGLELCGQLKSNKATAHIPIIMLTAKNLDIHKLEAMEKGADMYVTKPFDMDYLKKCINNILQRDNLLRDLFTRQLLIKKDSRDLAGDNEVEIFLKKVMMVIDNNLSNPDLSAEMISKEIGYSTTHLYRKLKLYTGQSTKDIIINYRMHSAAMMLSRKNGNVSETMYAVGLSSLASFSRSFKDKFGVSPSNYKPSNVNETDTLPFFEIKHQL